MLPTTMNHLITPSPWRWLPAAALLMAGCATPPSPDGGAAAVSQLTQPRIGQPVAIQRSAADTDVAATRTAALLQQPLTAERAAEIALLNHRGLQARFAELGIVEADARRGAQPTGPRLSLGRLAGGGVTEMHRALSFELLGLLTRPAANEAAQLQIEQSQLQAAADAVAAATEARRAFYTAVAAHELATYFEQVKDAAQASAELARRMQQAGNFSRLAQLREQAFQADTAASLARARQQAVAERERLVRALGTPAEFTLPERLPDLPAAPIEAQRAEQAALDQRLDVLIAQRGADAAAKALGLARATRFVDGLELGIVGQSNTGEATRRGPEATVGLPLFGNARPARAEAAHRQALHHAADVMLAARSQVREAHAAYRSAYELARHYRDEVVPLRRRIAEEQLLRYNGMLTSVFELLADAREQVASVGAAVEALRDHWIAETNLQSALTGSAAKEPR